MFFSNSTKNGHDPFSSSSFLDQSFFKHQDFHLPISFFHFPSPFELDDDDDLFLQPHNSLTNYNSQNNASASTIAETETPTPTATATMVVNSDQKTPRKRLCKKDRHSKISTARGLRDRRMRLSLPVARQFFGLQDLLGVDKGSKTVEWLLIQARPEILKLAKERNYSLDRAKSVCSSNSEGDIVSGIDEVGIGNEENQKEVQKLNSGKEKMKKKRMRQPRKTMAKELREKARARARARTKEKLQIQIQGSVDYEINYSKNYEWRKNISSSWSSPFETAEEESAGAQSYEKPISCTQFGVASDASAAMIDYQNSFEIIGKWSPSAASTFNYNLQQTGTLLQEQQQQHQQFADSQFFG